MSDRASACAVAGSRRATTSHRRITTPRKETSIAGSADHSIALRSHTDCGAAGAATVIWRKIRRLLISRAFGDVSSFRTAVDESLGTLDPLLSKIVGAPSTPDSERSLERLLMDHALPVIDSVVRRRCRCWNDFASVGAE